MGRKYVHYEVRRALSGDAGTGDDDLDPGEWEEIDQANTLDAARILQDHYLGERDVPEGESGGTFIVKVTVERVD